MAKNTESMWAQGLPEEANFWVRWLTEEQFTDAREPRLKRGRKFQLAHLINVRKGASVKVLDVGSGPVSSLGDILDGNEISIISLDPLASDYNEMLKRLNFEDLPKIVKGTGENLLDMYPENSFDVVFSGNALDHSYDPMRCLQNMLAVCKPGGWVNFRVKENEGLTQNYAGLHQWNFELTDEKIRIWNPEVSYLLQDHLTGVGILTAEISTNNPRKLRILNVEIKKDE